MIFCQNQQVKEKRHEGVGGIYRPEVCVSRRSDWEDDCALTPAEVGVGGAAAFSLVSAPHTCTAFHPCVRLQESQPAFGFSTSQGTKHFHIHHNHLLIAPSFLPACLYIVNVMVIGFHYGTCPVRCLGCDPDIISTFRIPESKREDEVWTNG